MLRAKITNSMQIPSEGKRLFIPIHTKSAVSIKNTKPHIQFSKVAEIYRHIREENICGPGASESKFKPTNCHENKHKPYTHSVPSSWRL